MCAPEIASRLLPLLLTQASPEAPSALSRLQVEGGVDASFAYNFNRPHSGVNFLPGTGTTARRHDEVTVNLASLGVSLAPEPVGFRVLLGFGTGIDVLHRAEPEADATGPDVWRYVQQASLSFAHGPLTLEAGIYPSHIGMESFQSQLNWTYTRSWTGEYSPYYQTGLKGTWRFTDHWSAQLQLLNGWQTIGDNNGGKALGTQVAYADDRWSAAFNTFVGNEGSGDAGALRLFADTVVTVKATGTVSIAATADVGRQARPGTSAALWYAAGANVRVQLAEPVAITARAEVYRDRDGLLSGTAQTLSEGTLTLEVRPADHLVLKAEARHDRSTRSVFDGPSPPLPRQHQTLLAVGAVATF
ncbi:porin [Corallococcus macrosporus]|uniref:Porin n=1 Tax=Corallococcus macrosporus TaxID=35 RepID=A0ABS3DGD6_9BACT|nr:porin [Corallococcus macrosporus]MBN8230386.1 porin [Corallococcus macrosporus]